MNLYKINDVVDSEFIPCALTSFKVSNIKSLSINADIFLEIGNIKQ